MDIKNLNRYALILAIGIITILLLYKAVHIPILKDEWETPVKYINHSVWDIMMYTSNSPNNHILNTLLVKLFVFVFGSRDQLILRLPNILSFLIYGWLRCFPDQQSRVKGRFLLFYSSFPFFYGQSLFARFFRVMQGIWTIQLPGTVVSQLYGFGLFLSKGAFSLGSFGAVAACFLCQFYIIGVLGCCYPNGLVLFHD